MHQAMFVLSASYNKGGNHSISFLVSDLRAVQLDPGHCTTGYKLGGNSVDMAAPKLVSSWVTF